MFSALDDLEVDSLLAGREPADPELAPLAEVVSLLRRSAASEPAPTMGPSLRAQLAGPPVVTLAVRRAGRSALLKAGAAAAAAAAVVALGVGASQNRLPAGLQDVLSSTANLVGIQVPSADDRPSHSSGGQSDDTGPSTNDREPGHEGTTPGGATPADPGLPGDKEPATPATPPEQGGATPGENRGTTPDLPPPAPATTPPPAPAEDTAPPPDDTSTPVVESAPEPSTQTEEPGHGPPSGTVTGSSRGNPSEAGELNGNGYPGGPADPAASEGPAGTGAGQASPADRAPKDPA